MSPIIPYNSEDIYQNIYWKELKKCVFDEELKDLDYEINMENL